MDPMEVQHTTSSTDEPMDEDEVPSKKRERKSTDGGENLTGRKEIGYEYLDHPADIQIHSWGPKLENALEQAVLAMYGYMTEMDKVESIFPYSFQASGNDLNSLLFAMMDEALVAFQSEPFFVGRRVVVDELDLEKFTVSYHIFGEIFDLNKHKQGTDVKAITYSNMQVYNGKDKAEIYVIIDI